MSFKRYLTIGVLLVIFIVIGGIIINQFIKQNKLQSLVDASDKSQVNAELIDQYFTSAVSHMQNKDYEKAVAQWHQILLINPNIPEVQVNMGFSLYELGKYAAAREFFISAMQRESFQANAYYGLAIVSEKMGDIEGATGAMRSYIHLAGDNDVFIRKARSALWEWEAQLSKNKHEQVQEIKKNTKQDDKK